MELRPPTEPIDDPFFAAVRRRHPDVDIVLLPAAGPAGEESAAAPGSPAEVTATLGRVATVTDRLWTTVAPSAGEQPETRCRFGNGPASVRAVARVASRRDDGLEVLVRLRHHLESHGWAVRRPRGVGVERLTGALDTLELTASYAEESAVLLLTITSESMAVGAERARELTSPGTRR